MRPFQKFTRIASLVFALCAVAVRGSSARTEVNLNTDWRFHFGDQAGDESAAFDDSSWTAIRLPHTWNALDGQDGDKAGGGIAGSMHGDYARGSGWYRRILRLSPEWRGRQIYLQFDGANNKTDVFINGTLIGTHLGGYARFRFDLTSHLKPDQDNVLAVRVNNEGNGIAPHSADYTFFGGLYRDVSLLITDPVQIETMDCASPGVYLAQTKVTPEKAVLNARVKVVNHDSSAAEATVRVIIVDATGKTVREVQNKTNLLPGMRGDVDLPLTIDAPHLWNGRSDPYLYTARVEVSTAGAVRDTIEQPLGLRFFRVDPQHGFLLNGEYLDLHGVSRHQDRLDRGWAISPADEREDMSIITEMGCTAVRVAHYQQSPLWYQLADQNGLILWSEIPFVNEAEPTDTFFNNALDQMRELIRQNYNHPSICFWGIGNETFDFGTDIFSGMVKNGPIQERQLQALHALARVEDPTRLTTYASFHSEKDVNFPRPGQEPIKRTAEPQRWYTDLTAFNKYYGWYYGEPEHAGDFFDSLHTRYPEQCLGVSEYGAGGSVTQHESTDYGSPARKRLEMDGFRPNSVAKFHPEEYQAYYHERTWRVLKARPYIWAKFIWNMFDFASDFRNEGDHPGRNDKGLVTYDRKTRKDAFYFYKAIWNTEPLVYITSRRFTTRKEANTLVKVYSNAPAVELSVNGKSLGQRPVSDGIVTWNDVALTPGDNQITATADFGGDKKTDSCVWNYTANQPQPSAARE